MGEQGGLALLRSVQRLLCLGWPAPQPFEFVHGPSDARPLPATGHARLQSEVVAEADEVGQVRGSAGVGPPPGVLGELGLDSGAELSPEQRTMRVGRACAMC